MTLQSITLRQTSQIKLHAIIIPFIGHCRKNYVTENVSMVVRDQGVEQENGLQKGVRELFCGDGNVK